MKQIVLNNVFYQRLSLLFLIILFTTSTAWADASGYCGDPDVNNGHNVTWTYVESTHTLTISGTGAMGNTGNFTNLPWEIYKGHEEGGANPSPDNAITSIVINEGITSICSYAFGGCYYATSVDIPITVTSIGNYAFADCHSLTTVSIPSNVTTIGHAAFASNYLLEEISIPEGVTTIGNFAFFDCPSLQRVSISSTVTSIGDGAFQYAEYNTEHHQGSKLSSVSFAKNSKLTAIGSEVFKKCTALEEITIPAKVTSIGYSAFEDCNNLTTIELLSTAPPTLDSDAFKGCNNLSSIIVPAGKGDIYKNAQDWSGYSSKITSRTSGSCGDNAIWSYSNGTLTIDGYGAMDDFQGATPWEGYIINDITKVVISTGITSIGKNAFLGSHKLADITIPTSVTSIGEFAFAGCFALEEITIPEGVTTIGDYAFYECEKLQTVNISSTVTRIGKYAFAANTSSNPVSELVSVTFANNSNLTTIDDYAFSACINLSNITIPNSVTSIGASAFADCYNITAFTIPNSVTTIGDYAFCNYSYSDNGLTSVTIPAIVTSIGNYAFLGCPLTSITVNSNNSSYMSDNGVLFTKDATTLITYPRAKTSTSYTVPTSVTTISNSAFSICNNLTQVVIPRTEAVSIGSNFYNCNNLQKIYVPAALKETYKTNTSSLATKFSAYASISISSGSNGTIGINNNTSALTIGENKYYTEGTTITLTVTANEHYSVATISFNDGSDHTINPVSDVYSFTMPASDVTISATFIADTYSITYELNGGTMPEGITNPESYTVETSDFTLNAPIKTGYTFTGWTGTGLTEATTNVTITSGSTGARAYTANWTAKNYDITYNLNGGALPEGKTNPATYTIESDNITLNNPTRDYYTFTGWTGTGLSEATSTVTIATGSTGARAYTANWTAKSYSITYDLNGGTMPEGKTNPTTYTVESEDISLNAPTKTGYTFAGWTGTDLTSAIKTVTITQGSTGNRTYTATWTINQYTITFDSNGGSNVASITQDYGSTITAPADPVRKDYIFDGWDKEIPKKMPAENITITAKWREVLISPEDKVTVNGEIFYMMPDNTVSVIFSNIKAFLALTQKAADCATINSNGGIDFAKGQNVHILLLNLIKGQIIIFNINGHIAVDSSSLSPKNASSRAASCTRADGYIELGSGVEYEVQKSGNIMLTIQLEYEPATINSIKVGSGSTGIEGVSPSTGSEANSEKWYDLNGRQLNAKPTIPGLYICNGKKIQIK